MARLPAARSRPRQDFSNGGSPESWITATCPTTPWSMPPPVVWSPRGLLRGSLMKLGGFFAALVAVLIGAGPIAAQTSSEIYHVGVLSVAAEPTDQSPLGAGLIRGFARQGFILGKNLALERRAAHGQLDRLPELVDELVASKVAVIVTSGYPAALAAKQHSTLPVVVVQAGDPVEDGLRPRFGRAGGPLPGPPEIAAELSTKRLAL